MLTSSSLYTAKLSCLFEKGLGLDQDLDDDLIKSKYSHVENVFDFLEQDWKKQEEYDQEKEQCEDVVKSEVKTFLG